MSFSTHSESPSLKRRPTSNSVENFTSSNLESDSHSEFHSYPPLILVIHNPFYVSRFPRLLITRFFLAALLIGSIDVRAYTNQGGEKIIL
jgi:hypothetical protein